MTSHTGPEVDPMKVERILAQLDNLPPLAPVATRILALTQDSDASTRQLADLVQTDPSLTARLLSLLHRAEHGVRSSSISVEQAVVLLGFNAVFRKMRFLPVLLGPVRVNLDLFSMLTPVEQPAVAGTDQYVRTYARQARASHRRPF